MPAFEASPEGDAKGGIVVVQEAFGVTEHIESIARRLADAGWYAVAPAFFHRQGSPVLAYDDFAAVMPVMKELNAEGITVDLKAAFAHLETSGFPATRTGIVGFCMGGSVTFYAATLRALGRRRDLLRRGRGRGPLRLALTHRAGSEARRRRGSGSTATSTRESPRPRWNSFGRLSPRGDGADRDRPLPRRRPRLQLQRPARRLQLRRPPPTPGAARSTGSIVTSRPDGRVVRRGRDRCSALWGTASWSWSGSETVIFRLPAPGCSLPGRPNPLGSTTGVGDREVGDVRQRRIVQAFSVTVLGLALACAPMAAASAKSKPKHHPKKHQPRPPPQSPRRRPRVGSTPGASSA